MSFFSAFASILGSIVGLVTVVGFSFFVLDKLLDTQSKTNIRKRVEEFWFRTASLEFHEQFSLALRSRYTQMRRLREVFLAAFVIITVALALSSGVLSAMVSSKTVREYYGELSNKDFADRFEGSFVIFVGIDESGLDQDFDDVQDFGDVDGQCTKGDGFEALQSAYKLVRIRASVERFLELHREDALSMRLFNGIVGFIDPLLFALPLERFPLNLNREDYRGSLGRTNQIRFLRRERRGCAMAKGYSKDLRERVVAIV